MLTRKQNELLMFINKRLNDDGVSPSFDEMKEALRLKSKSGIHRLITGLEERGFIKRLAHKARALEVIRLPEDLGIGGRKGEGGARFSPNVIQGNFGGAITGDPRQLIDRAPGDNEFTIPDCSDPRAIISYALHRLEVIIAAYQDFLDKVRGRDDVSFALVVDLLAAETHRRADVKAALGGK